MKVIDFSADSWQATSPGLQDGLSRRMEALDQLSQGLTSLADTATISGQGADKMRAYIREVHLPIIQSLLIAVSTFQTAIGVYWDGYSQVDTDGNFRLVNDEFDAHVAQLAAGTGELRGFASTLSSIASDASHLVSLGDAGAGAARRTVEGFEALQRIVTDQQETWDAYEATDPGFNQVKELIAKLQGVLGDIGNLTEGSGRSYTSGSFGITLEQLGGLLTPMVTYCQDNQEIASNGWEQMFSGYIEDVEAEEERKRREQAGWDLLWDGLQIVAGAVVTAIGVGLTPFTGGFSLALTVLGGSMLVGGVNSMINHASIANTGQELNLIGNASQAVGQWYDATVVKFANESGSPGLQYLVGAGAAVGDMVGGTLQLNVKDTVQGIGTLISDKDARDQVLSQLGQTWEQIKSGDAYVAGYATATIVSMLVPGAGASKLQTAGSAVARISSTALHGVKSVMELGKDAARAATVKIKSVLDNATHVLATAKDGLANSLHNLASKMEDAGQTLSGGPRLAVAGTGTTALRYTRDATTPATRAPNFTNNRPPSINPRKLDTSVTDPKRVERVRDDFDFDRGQKHDNALANRRSAQEALDQAAKNRDATISQLRDLDININPKDLTVNKIDDLIRNIQRTVDRDPLLSPAEKVMRKELLGELRERANIEREANVIRNRASEALGDVTAAEVAVQKGERVVVNGANAPPGRFDLVSISEDGKKLIVTEAKGGSANLSSKGRKIDGIATPQGSTNYFSDVFKKDPELQAWLRKNSDVVDKIRNGSIEVEYRLVRAQADGKVEVFNLILNKDLLNLGLS